MNQLMTGLATMIMSIITFVIIANFVTPTVITGTDTGSTLIKSVFLLVVAAIVIVVPLLVLVRMWKGGAKD
jgi:hypothetical protein